MGKMICLYGINNLGKSTQAKLLIKSLEEKGFSAFYLKYPIYDSPTGELLNKILRDVSFRSFDQRAKQLIYTANRFNFEKKLEELLAEYDYVVAEDYVGTGLAWGETLGVDPQYLEDINAPLRKADLEILMDGERFTEAVESGHAHETNDEATERCRAVHLRLGEKYGWKVVNANQTIEEVQADILKEIL